jgi:hypothetical protein
MRIVRFNCGCIGTEPDDNGMSAVLMACDSSMGDPGMANRIMEGKTFEPMPNIYAVEVWRAFVDAAKYQQLRGVLRELVEE